MKRAKRPAYRTNPYLRDKKLREKFFLLITRDSCYMEGVRVPRRASSRD